ncbi:MAG: menaquinone biosynthesis decarboxylase [Bacteroidetes bacterium]|nr:MAG: menaquinone biosynthesis decarboxylase [Bacteroidota bacterium]
MPYNSLQQFINSLEKENELLRIKTYVNPELEITEITDRISKLKGGGKALLFENTGTDFPLLINSLGSTKRICMALGIANLDDIATEIDNLLKRFNKPKIDIIDKLKLLFQLKEISSWMPKLVNKKGACQQVINMNPDMFKLPILKCWPHDGGRFITLPMVHTKDPDTGARNVGMYRVQIFEKDLCAMHWHRHKTGASHFNKYKQIGKKMPIAVALGGDPAYTYSATAPMPENFDEYMLAGFLRKKRVELVKCITQDIEVPADADIVIEGYIDTDEDFILEGPFGDHTGFYSLADYYPRFHITCITNRKNAVYPATIVGIPSQEDAYIAKATERIFLSPIKMTLLPEIIDIDLPKTGVAHNLTIVKINKTFPGQAFKVANSLWGAGQMMFNKIMIVVDKDVDIHNYDTLAKHVSKNINPQSDFLFSRGPLDILDHSATKMSYGSKLCIDATQKFDEEIISNVKTQKEKFSLIKDKDKIENDIKEIYKINDDLLSQNISIVFISVKKDDGFDIKKISKQVFEYEGFNDVKMILFVDFLVDLQDVSTVAWVGLNNIDPKRDSIFIEPKQVGDLSHMVFDSTRKNKNTNNFDRDWPNIVVSLDDTIKKIDEIWESLNIGDFIKSPSLKFKNMVINDDAVVK